MKKILIIGGIILSLSIIGISASLRYAKNPIKTGDNIQLTVMDGNVTTTIPLSKALLTLQAQLAQSHQMLLANQHELNEKIIALEKKLTPQ